MFEEEDKAWKLIYDAWEPEKQPLRETLCTLGNGYFATRGAFEESHAGGYHYPGTYLAGAYDRLETEIAGRVIENEDLVNWPNWLWLTFRAEDGDWLDLDSMDVLAFRQELDVRSGVLERRVRVRDSAGRETSLLGRRIVHMAKPNLAAIEWKVKPENWSGRLEILSGIDGSVTNSGVARYRDLKGKHLRVLETRRIGEDGILLLAETAQSRIRTAQAARTTVSVEGETVSCDRSTEAREETILQRIRLPCSRHETVAIEKTVALCSSRDFALSEPAMQASRLVRRARSFGALLAEHESAWSRLWKRCDLELTDATPAQLVLRFHIFHLLQTASRNTVDRDVGIPSRGWHGEAYRGHILWDELFIFPFLNLSIPELTRELLMYRYRRLDEARHQAREAGYRGAMYPWQSASDGREVSQVIHLNPRSGRWVPDDTHLQRHVNAAIAYNVWQYYQSTGDREFLESFGAEMILEIARFWADLATLNRERDRYEIRGVVGPDEFHTRYPGSDEPGIDNNAYTNVMAAWVLRCARYVLDTIPEDRRQELLDDLETTERELAAWDEISRKIYIPFHGDGIISQFEGYDDLEELDWDAYREKYPSIQRLDRILEAEGDSPNRYKASKQADVLMLFFLFSAEELRELFETLGYPFEGEMIPRNIRYYIDRTSHGSTLSRVVHAWVLARSDRSASWNLFQHALESDIADIQGGTTPEGIHLGAMAGTLDLMQRCYTGLEMRQDVLWLNPQLPADLRRLRLRVRYRGRWLSLDMDHQRLSIAFEKGRTGQARVGVRGRVHLFREGDTGSFDL